jgi:hypothetical protein
MAPGSDRYPDRVGIACPPLGALVDSSLPAAAVFKQRISGTPHHPVASLVHACAISGRSAGPIPRDGPTRLSSTPYAAAGVGGGRCRHRPGLDVSCSRLMRTSCSPCSNTDCARRGGCGHRIAPGFIGDDCINSPSIEGPTTRRSFWKSGRYFNNIGVRNFHRCWRQHSKKSRPKARHGRPRAQTAALANSKSSGYRPRPPPLIVGPPEGKPC